MNNCDITISAEYGQQHHNQLGECFAAKMSLPSLLHARNVIEGLGGRTALYGNYAALSTLLDAVFLSLAEPMTRNIYGHLKQALLEHVQIAWEL